MERELQTIDENETLDELVERGSRNDIRIGDFIVCRSMRMACGVVTGQGIWNKRAYWIYTNSRGKKDAMEKSEAFMPGFHYFGGEL